MNNMKVMKRKALKHYAHSLECGVLLIALSIVFLCASCLAEDLDKTAIEARYDEMSIQELEALREETFAQLSRINKALSSKKSSEHDSSAAIDSALSIESLFPDENLAMHVRDEIGKASIKENITQEELDSVTRIDDTLSGTAIGDLTGISHLRNLKSLVVHFKSTTDFSEEMLQLPYLNMIYVVDYKHPTLPSWFTQLSSLARLYLLSSDLVSLPEDLGNMSALTCICLNGSHYITSVPDSIGELTQLEELDLQGLKISTLPASLGNCQLLKTLDLRYSSISEIPETVLALNIEKLEISNTNIK